MSELMETFHSRFRRHENRINEACKKLYTQEALNDRMRFKKLIVLIGEDKENPGCYCTQNHLNDYLFLLEKYFCVPDLEIKQLRKMVEEYKFESC